jgi:glycosyltransferase involved in cell wall biosynthesis
MNPNEPLVSIVIPVYNGSNYLHQAIESALAQTYDNVEIIVVNDGSTDDGATRAVAQRYGERIRYFEKPNGGCGSALNFGVEQMHGEYFSWLSHDDLYKPDKVKRQVQLIQASGGADVIVYGGYDVIGPDGEKKYSVRPDDVLPYSKLEIPLLPLLRGLMHGCAMLIPKSFFDRYGHFDVSLPSTQDYALWFTFLRHAQLRYCPEVLICSRVHPEQGSKKIEKHIEECNALWIGFLNALEPHEMVAMEESEYRFLDRTHRFLRDHTQYDLAIAHADKLRTQCRQEMVVSIVIPFYNRIGWAVEAVQSALNQTHAKVEVILVNDGSTEDIHALQRIEEQDRRVKILHQVNSGPARARNNGVIHATGQYTAFLDADDKLYPTKVQAQLDDLLTHDALFSHTSYQRMDLEGNVIGAVSSGLFNGRVFPAIMASCPVAMPTVMGVTALFKRHPFPEHLEIGEDVCLWIKLASMHEFRGLDESLSMVRIGPTTAAFNARKQISGLLNIAGYIASTPELAQHQRQLRSLLADAIGVLDQSAAAPSSAPVRLLFGKDPQAGTLRHSLGLVRRSLRNHGLRGTVARVRRRLGL